MKLMEHFATSLHATFPKDRPKDERIRVAIIDSGVDWSHETISSNRHRIVATKSFVTLKENSSLKKDVVTTHVDDIKGKVKMEEENDAENCKDSIGHGTHAADILVRLAPSTELFIAKYLTTCSFPIVTLYPTYVYL